MASQWEPVLTLVCNFSICTRSCTLYIISWQILSDMSCSQLQQNWHEGIVCIFVWDFLSLYALRFGCHFLHVILPNLPSRRSLQPSFYVLPCLNGNYTVMPHWEVFLCPSAKACSKFFTMSSQFVMATGIHPTSLSAFPLQWTFQLPELSLWPSGTRFPDYLQILFLISAAHFLISLSFFLQPPLTQVLPLGSYAPVHTPCFTSIKRLALQVYRPVVRSALPSMPLHLQQGTLCSPSVKLSISPSHQWSANCSLDRLRNLDLQNTECIALDAEALRAWADLWEEKWTRGINPICVKQIMCVSVLNTQSQHSSSDTVHQPLSQAWCEWEIASVNETRSMGRGALISGARRTFTELRITYGSLGAISENKSLSLNVETQNVHPKSNVRQIFLAAFLTTFTLPLVSFL